MKVKKIFNRYILVKEIPDEEPEKSAIYIPGNKNNFQRGKVVMLPDDVDDSWGVNLGDTVAFYRASGIEAGEDLIVHIENVIGNYGK